MHNHATVIEPNTHRKSTFHPDYGIQFNLFLIVTLVYLLSSPAAVSCAPAKPVPDTPPSARQGYVAGIGIHGGQAIRHLAEDRKPDFRAPGVVYGKATLGQETLTDLLSITLITQDDHYYDAHCEPDGTYWIVGVPAGLADLFATLGRDLAKRSPAYRRVSREVKVLSDQPTQVDLPFTFESTVLSGSITLDGEPTDRAEFRINFETKGVSKEFVIVTANASGKYEVKGLPAGKHHVHIFMQPKNSAGGFSAKPREVTIQSSGPTVMNIDVVLPGDFFMS